MTTYTTIDGDVLDAIAFKELGSEALVPQILALNPGLAGMPHVLPAGVRITLPAAAPVPATAPIRLWGSG